MKEIFKIIKPGILLFFLFCQHTGFSQSGILIKENTLIPEGIAIDPRNGNIFISSIAKQKIVKVTQNNEISDFIKEGDQGFLEAMAKNIVKAMEETGVKKLIFISSMGIYNVPLNPLLKSYRKAADVIEASDLEYTILRPTWFTKADEVDYETTRKGEPESGSVISQKSLATLIAKIIESPENYICENMGVNKPNS